MTQIFPALPRRRCMTVLLAVAATAPLAALPAFEAAARTLKKNDWLIVPGKRFGPITATTTERELIRLFGRRNVRRGAAHRTADHQGEKVTVVFRSTRNEIQVFWKKRYTHPDYVRTYAKGGRWRTGSGLRIGSSLAAVEKANGRPFGLSGFEWDYGGFASWNKGRLPRSLLIRFATTAPLPSRQMGKILGDVQLKSTDILVRKARPVVSQISLTF